MKKTGGLQKEVGKRIQAGWAGWRKFTGSMCDIQGKDAQDDD